MKRVLCLVSGAMLVASMAQAQGAAPGPTGLAAGLQRSYNGIKLNLTQAAEKLADADYGFKPSPEIRSFGGQLAHVADAQYNFCSAAKGVANPMAGQSLEKTKTSKVDVMKALADSFTFCDDAYSALTDASAAELVTQGRGQVARGSVLANNTAHNNEEYGIITVYLRLKQMVPPSTERQMQGRGR